jgi:hypothetical protein
VTQPFAPGLPVENYEIEPVAPMPVAVPGAPPSAPTLNWVERQQAIGDADVAEKQAQAAAENSAAEAKAAELEALREKHGAITTTSGAFLRGALDALLAPAAGVAAEIETAGEALGNKAIKDFGRSYGKAASGKSAMEALAFVFGGGGEEGMAMADRSSAMLREQQEARPTLATVSRLAGAAGVGLGLGGAASGHTAASTMVGLNVLEGASMGAQMAYEESAPLRDVLTSAAIGGLIGGAATGAGELVSKGIRNTPDLSKVFGKVQAKADQLAVKSVVGADAAVWNQLADDPGRIARVASRTRELVGKNADEIIPIVDAKAAEAIAGELTLARAFDEGVDASGVMGKVDDLISSYKRSGVGDVKAIGDQLERTVAPLRSRLLTEIEEVAPGKLGVAADGIEPRMLTMLPGETTKRIVQRAPKFSELAEFRRELAPTAKVAGGITNPTADAHRSLLKLISSELDDAVAAKGPSVAKGWKEVSRTADDFQVVAGALERDMVKRAKAPLISGGEAQSALAGALMAGVTASNPIAAIGGLLGGALVHKGINKIGGAAVSALMNRFAKMGTRVSIRAAGGREMAEVMTALAKTKALGAELAQAAGDNPVARQQANNLAREIAATALEKRAGKFNPDAWHEAPLSPVQKVLYRGQILDKVSEDVATVAAKTRALQPAMPDALDVNRIAKLTKNADGPAAIGGLRGKAEEIAESVPPTPTGEAAAVALRRAAMTFERADVPTAMARGHELAGWLDASAELAGDEGTKAFVSNAAKEIRGQLGSDAFGEAGKHYRALSTATQSLDNMTDPKAVREALRGLQGHGALPNALRQAQDQIARSYDAAAALAGVKRPKSLAKDLTAGEQLFHAAEEALTLDGKAMERVFEVSQHVGIHEAAAPHTQANEMTVADAVDGEMDNLVPILRDGASGGSPARYRPMQGAAAAATLPLTVEESREKYKERLDTLTKLQTQMPGTDGGEHPLIAADAHDKMATLLRDIPKPPSTPLGPMGPDSLSSDDLRLANAMWEATTEPLSVVRDLSSGYVDPDKASYAWKQYPGLQRACQAGIVDVLSNDLSQEERDGIPENILTQIDATFGFGGTLQETSDPIFAARMSEVFHADQQKRPPPPQGGMLKLPGADPTFTSRLAGNA